MVKNPPSKAGDTGSIPGSGRSPGGEHGNPLQHSRLGNPMDRGAWWATVHWVKKSRTRLKHLSIYTHKAGPETAHLTSSWMRQMSTKNWHLLWSLALYLCKNLIIAATAASFQHPLKEVQCGGQK